MGIIFSLVILRSPQYFASNSPTAALLVANSMKQKYWGLGKCDVSRLGILSHSSKKIHFVTKQNLVRRSFLKEDKNKIIVAYCCLIIIGRTTLRGAILTRPGVGFNIKMPSYQYRKSHCGDKTILRPSYFHNGISYTGKMTSIN